MKILLHHSSLGNRNMIDKNAALENSINEPSASRLALATFVLVVAAARIRAAAKAQAPDGYGDGEGFHFGSPHDREQALVPPNGRNRNDCGAKLNTIPPSS